MITHMWEANGIKWTFQGNSVLLFNQIKCIFTFPDRWHYLFWVWFARQVPIFPKNLYFPQEPKSVPYCPLRIGAWWGHAYTASHLTGAWERCRRRLERTQRQTHRNPTPRTPILMQCPLEVEKGLQRARAGIEEVKVLILVVCQLFLKVHVYKNTVYVFCSVLCIQSVSSPQLPGPDASPWNSWSVA